jgi:hypothetical protein
MKRSRSLLLVASIGTIGALCGLGGCQSAPATATMQDIPAPTDDLGRPMGRMPLAVGDRVGRAVYMNRSSLVARGVVDSPTTFAKGSEPAIDISE